MVTLFFGILTNYIEDYGEYLRITLKVWNSEESTSLRTIRNRDLFTSYYTKSNPYPIHPNCDRFLFKFNLKFDNRDDINFYVTDMLCPSYVIYMKKIN